MQTIKLGRTDLNVTPVGFGAFKIGRNEKIKYPQGFPLPSERETEVLLNRILDLGIRLIDTAPAYGISEERIGRALATRRHEYCLATKAGEMFHNGISRYEYTAEGIRNSVERSLLRLKTDVIDIVFVHSNGRDLYIQQQTDVIEALQQLKEKGLIRSIGFSGKQVAGAEYALGWADVLMVEYHMGNTSHSEIMDRARQENIGIIVKKGLASGYLAAPEAIRFVLGNPVVHSIVIGGRDPKHIEANCEVAQSLFNQSAA